MKYLIVTADDFGASLEINEAVERAHREGILTAASLMVGGDCAQDAVQRAKGMPNLGVGLHIALTNAKSVLPRERVPALVNRNGNFDGGLVRAGFRFYFSATARRQLEAEIRAQFEAFAATGLPLDHVDAHNHIYVHPTVFSTIVRAGREFDMRAMRVPREPFRWSWVAVSNAVVMGPWVAIMRRRLRHAGMTTNDAVFGLNDTGKMDERRMLDVLSRLPEGVSELYCHPAVSAADYARPEELEALLSPRVREAITQQGVKLVAYSSAVPEAVLREAQGDET
jgi:hopanoid biosynthesis associated protein HpnK